jgi:hypothetical protein
MDWQSMVIFSVTFAVTNQAVSRSVSFVENWRRGKELNQMLSRLENIDQLLTKKTAKVKRVK